jgi:lysine 2,3-aminomutase
MQAEAPSHPQSPLPNLGWKEQFRLAIRTPRQLAEHGLVSIDALEAQRAEWEKVAEKYSVFIPLYYAGLIDRENPTCPIRLQAVPRLEELLADDRASNDPLGDFIHRPADRLTHRYQGRALLHLTVNCPMYCRYCFRKSLLNENSEDFFAGGLEEAFGYLQSTPSIEEVILSGGDPLMVTDAALGATLERLGKIAHLRRVRIHTRAPVTMPARVDQGLVEVLKRSPLPVIVVTHFNHPKEATEMAAQACTDLRNSVQLLLNQSVLLKGVNDDVETLRGLSERLFEMGVTPYYLHQLDKAQGTMHFEVPVETGRALHRELRQQLPGYLVPRYVVDGGDAGAKELL